MPSFWDMYARVYDELALSFPYLELQHLAFQWLAPEAGDRILDVGCGTGQFLKRVITSGVPCRLTGVELAPAMFERAAEKVGPHAALVRHDVNEGVPSADGSFDAVVCLNVLYALRDPEATLRELRRVTRPGGRLILANLHTPDRIAALRAHYSRAFRERPIPWRRETRLAFAYIAILALNGYIVRRAGDRTFHLFTPDALAERVKAAGFDVLDRRDALYGNTAVLLKAQAV